MKVTTTWWIGAAVATAAVSWVLTLALCLAAARGDRAEAAAAAGGGGRGQEPAVPPPPRPSALEPETTAARARSALRGRTAWTFASPAAHARLRMAERHGHDQVPDVEALALRTAGLAINGGLPVIVPSPADGTTIAVPIPFADGRLGALVVTTSRWTSIRPWAIAALDELASEHAARGATVRAIARG
jgi:hypothetical protein